MKKSALLLTLVALLTSVFASARNEAETEQYERLESKAERFFKYKEWASANAMYILMLEQKPECVSTYAKSIVVNIMAGDTVQALNLIPRAMKNNIHFDTLMKDVRNISFSIGRGELYEHFLIDIKDTYPWLTRVADNYLMKYYAFRQNGPELIRYAEMMLNGLPDNLNFLRMLAHGQMLIGQSDAALETWLRIYSLYPENYDTVLDIANYYDTISDIPEALKWMRRANNMHASPYIRSRIAALEKIR